MGIFGPHPNSLASLIETVAAHERALALWGFLETTHQQLSGNAKHLSPALQAIVDASRQEAEAVLTISRRLDEMMEAIAVSYFDEEETSEEEHLQDFKAAQILLEKARDHGYA